jgi:hypothetical protein
MLGVLTDNSAFSIGATHYYSSETAAGVSAPPLYLDKAGEE